MENDIDQTTTSEIHNDLKEHFHSLLSEFRSNIQKDFFDLQEFSNKLKEFQIRNEELNMFIDIFFNEILEMLKENELTKFQNIIYYVLTDFLSSIGNPLDVYPKDKTILFLNLLYTIDPDYDCEFLELLLYPLCADKIISSDTHQRPFIDFLIYSYADELRVSKVSQKVILLMLKNPGNSCNYLSLNLISSFLDLFKFFSSVSPTLSNKSLPINLLEFCVNILTTQIFQMNYSFIINDYFYSLIQYILMETPPYMCLKTISIFFSKLKQKLILSALINLVIDPNGNFAKNICAWLMNHTSDTLKLLISMLHTRSSALKSAYFFLDDSEPIFLTYFPKVEKKPTSNMFNPYSLLKTDDPELPQSSVHVISVLPLILDLFSKFWSFSIETDELMLDFIEQFASIKNNDSMTFCFTAGKNISKITDDLLEQNSTDEPEKSALLLRFVNSMNRILSD